MAVGAVMMFFITVASPVAAHVSEQGLVLLLPTDFYIGSGVAAVVLTIILVAFLPHEWVRRLFSSVATFNVGEPKLKNLTSLLSFGGLIFLVFLGLNGPRDPLTNLLPLVIWTLWWIGFLLVQAVFGDLWRWLNPWSGVYHFVCRIFHTEPLLVLPARFGVWPGIIAFLGSAAFALADLSPDDPARLATLVGVYWLYTFMGMLIFGGEDWLARGECFTILLRKYAGLSPFGSRDGKLRFGVPGWRLIHVPSASVSGGIFVLMILATGTFDGLNETFWWFGQIGINPLAFPGRSAVVVSTLAGLLAANVLLPSIFAITVYTGLLITGDQAKFARVFGRLALAILPIAVAYHFSHFLTVMLINAQYSLAAASDPWATGADYLGLGVFYVTTGFLNTSDTVKMIWLSQAGVIVAGHIVAVLMAHAIALDVLGTIRKATLSQVPTAVFMVAYTLLGLWLLASPRGL